MQTVAGWLFWPNTILLFSLLSVAWVETDLYRYCVPFLLLEGILAYYARPDRPAIGLMGVLCGLWGLHVATRLILGITAEGHLYAGSAEGIYLFAMVYPTLGYAFYLHREQARAIVAWFLGISLLALAVSVDVPLVLAGERVLFLFHANTIHASVSGGFILLAALCTLFALVKRIGKPAGAVEMQSISWLAVAVATVALASIGILGARSKGIWIALAVAAPILLAAALLQLDRATRRWLGLATAVGTVALLAGFHREISAELLPNAAGAAVIAGDVLGGVDSRTALDLAIRNGTVPFSFNERLQLWVNAFEVWSASPVLGSGVQWIGLWRETSYADTPYTLIHNGFLEIAVRYGIVGLLFYGLTIGFGIRQAWLCRRLGAIGDPAFILYVSANLFFLLTLLTNSNNRLAMGEAFMLLSGGLGFCFSFIRQDVERGLRPAAATVSDPSDDASARA